MGGEGVRRETGKRTEGKRERKGTKECAREKEGEDGSGRKEYRRGEVWRERGRVTDCERREGGGGGGGG